MAGGGTLFLPSLPVPSLPSDTIAYSISRGRRFEEETGTHTSQLRL